MVAPFTGLKSSAAFPVTRKTNKDITSIASNGGLTSLDRYKGRCYHIEPVPGA
jgi:hypothetical protein